MISICKYIRLRKLCKALSIPKLYKWQYKYIFGKNTYLPYGRYSGKTTAVIIKTLIKCKWINSAHGGQGFL